MGFMGSSLLKFAFKIKINRKGIKHFLNIIYKIQTIC